MRGRVGVRWRTTLAATLVVAIFLALAGLVFVVLLDRQLEAAIVSNARQQAADVAAQTARVGGQVDLTSGPAGDQSLVQVLDDQGRVVAATPDVRGAPPVWPVQPDAGRVWVERGRALPIGEGDSYVVVARGVQGPQGHLVVVVAQSLELVGQSSGIVIRLLLLGYPLVVLGVGGACYWLVGRALAPVEGIRAQVAEVERTAALDARVPVPSSGDEIARLASTMNAMLARLQGANDRQRRFVADASHELRSPLATIRASYEIGQRHPGLDSEADVLSELNRLDALVGDLLLLATLDEAALGPSHLEVDLDDIVQAEAHRVRRQGTREVSTQITAQRVLGDRSQLTRVVRNLADNAVRHASTQVGFGLVREGDRVLLTVTDDGPGIAAEDRARVFERFVRLDDSRTRASGGSGLGLAIVRELIGRHGGSVAVSAHDDRTVFSVWLPTAH